MGSELKKAQARIPARRARTAIAIHNDLVFTHLLPVRSACLTFQWDAPRETQKSPFQW